MSFGFLQVFLELGNQLGTGDPRGFNKGLSFKFSVQQDTYCNGHRRWFTKLLRRQSCGGCRFNPDCKRVTIQEFLTLAPGYG